MPTSDTPDRATPVSELRLPRRVQFYETDMAGVVHFSWFFRYMEEAEHALWRAAGLSVASVGAEIGWPRVSTSFEYRRPLRFEDEIEVHIRVAAVNARTIRFVCTLTRAGEVVATGDMTVACVSQRPHEPMKAIPIPPHIAARFEVASDVR